MIYSIINEYNILKRKESYVVAELIDSISFILKLFLKLNKNNLSYTVIYNDKINIAFNISNKDKATDYNKSLQSLFDKYLNKMIYDIEFKCDVNLNKFEYENIKSWLEYEYNKWN